MMRRFHQRTILSRFLILFFFYIQKSPGWQGGIRERAREFPEFHWNWIWWQWDRATSRRETLIKLILDLSHSLSSTLFSIYSLSSFATARCYVKNFKSQKEATIFICVDTICIESCIVHTYGRGKIPVMEHGGTMWEHNVLRYVGIYRRNIHSI